MSLSLPLPYLHFSSAATPLDTSEKRRCGGGGLPCKRGLGSPSQSKSGSCLADGRVGQRRPRSLSQEALRARWCPGHTQLPVPGDKPGTECSLAQQCAVTEGSQGPEALPGSGQHVPGQTHGSGVRPPARATCPDRLPGRSSASGSASVCSLCRFISTVQGQWSLH